MKILIRSLKDKVWHLVESAAYGKETELQRLLVESRGLISIDEVRPNSSPLVLAVRKFLGDYQHLNTSTAVLSSLRLLC
jgi:hypothetical protein